MFFSVWKFTWFLCFNCFIWRFYTILKNISGSIITKRYFSILSSLHFKNAMNLTSRRCHCEELYMSDWTSVFSATSRHRESWLSGLCPYYYCSVHLKLILWGLWQILIIVEKVTASFLTPSPLPSWSLLLNKAYVIKLSIG